MGETSERQPESCSTGTLFRREKGLEDTGLGCIRHALTVQDHVGPLLNEGSLGQILHHGEGRLFDPPGDGLNLTMLDLQFGELLKEFFIDGVLLATLPGDRRILAKERR